MTARLEFLLGIGSLIVAGLVITILYLRTELQKAEKQTETGKSPRKVFG